jgi:hypothetical protein
MIPNTIGASRRWYLDCVQEVFGFVKRNRPKRSEGRMLLAEKGVWGKGRSPCPRLSTQRPRSANCAPDSSRVGEIPWPELSRFDDEEMKRLMIEVANKSYSFLSLLFSSPPSTLEKVLSTLQQFDMVSNWGFRRSRAGNHDETYQNDTSANGISFRITQSPASGQKRLL